MSNREVNNKTEFRKIPSLKFLYEVSEDGRVFRNVKSKKQNKIIVDYHHAEKGYCFTFICRDGVVQRIPIARVVAECWLGAKPEGMEIDHADRNSLNNHYKNLRYVTKSEQMKNRDHSGIIETGKKNLEAYRRKIMKPVALIKKGERVNFESYSAAARYMAEQTGKTVGQCQYKLSIRRAHIYDYDVEYLPIDYETVETACARATAQGTVQ